MRAEERRQAIQDILQSSPQPVSASALAARFSVSRQIIVGDIALLRAAGADISATPRGYICQPSPAGLIRRVACQHDAAGMAAELNTMVDNGCTVLDVIVEHPIYGQLTGPLRLSSRYDVSQFIARCAQEEAQPLSMLTEGIHLHTLSCPDEAAFQRVQAALRSLGVLLEG
ncbi:transcription repressor NadR [uncultured Dysosmobacter sp.]|uniref:transcription repressor NadR n=1 Tax=uncultured Dysosmobacter sp. TaxID=2591384 RepID=UPI002619039C|nr:transcription repressor NadR [uncultured Dysosmobacter sp.]